MTCEQLCEIRDVYKEREQIENEIARLESMRISPRTAAYENRYSRSSLKSDIQSDLIARMNELICLYNSKLRQCVVLTDLFEKNLERLTSKERRIMRMYYIDGMTWEQIGKFAQKSEMWVYNIRRRAIEKILT